MDYNKIFITIVVLHCSATSALLSLFIVIVHRHRHCYHRSLSLFIVVIVHCFCNPFNALFIVVIVYCYIQYCYCCHNINIVCMVHSHCSSFQFIVHCYCSVLFIVYQACVIVIVVHCALLFICIVYCHCLLSGAKQRVLSPCTYVPSLGHQILDPDVNLCFRVLN